MNRHAIPTALLRALLWKELRDARGALLLALGLLAFVLLGAKLAFDLDAELRAGKVLPAALGLVAALLAAESIGRDASSGVGSVWERLPVDRALVWCAKAISVVAGSALFLGGALVLELALRAVEPAPESVHAVGLLLPSAQWLPVIPCATGFVLLWSAVLRQSLPGALVGVGCVAVVPLLGEHLSGRTAHFIALMVGHWPTSRWLGIGTLAAATGSLLAFRVGGWRRLALRRGAAAAGGLLLVLGPALGRTTTAALAAMHFGIFDPEAKLLLAEPSPDGRHLAVRVRRDDPRRLQGRTAILDRSTGSWRELEGFPSFLTFQSGVSLWTQSGELNLLRVEHPLSRKGGLICEHIDPRTGRAVWQAVAADARDARALARNWQAAESWCRADVEGDEYVLTWKGRPERLRIPRSRATRESAADPPWIAAAAQPGLVFLAREGALVRHDLGSGEERELYRSDGSDIVHLQLSADDRWIGLWESGARVILETASGRVVQRALGGIVGWCREPGRVALVWNVETRDTEILFEDGTRRVLASGSARWIEDGPDGFLRWEIGGQRVERVGLDGELLEVLYAPDLQRR